MIGFSLAPAEGEAGSFRRSIFQSFAAGFVMTESQREHYIKIYRGSLVACGTVTIGLAAAHLINQPFDLRWLALAAFAVVGSWLAASRIPGAKSIVTVSDTFIFLTLLLCG